MGEPSAIPLLVHVVIHMRTGCTYYALAPICRFARPWWTWSAARWRILQVRQNSRGSREDSTAGSVRWVSVPEEEGCLAQCLSSEVSGREYYHSPVLLVVLIGFSNHACRSKRRRPTEPIFSVPRVAQLSKTAHWGRPPGGSTVVPVVGTNIAGRAFVFDV